MSYQKMSDIELIVKRKELQAIIDEGDPAWPLDIIQNNLDAIILEMRNRVKSKQ